MQKTALKEQLNNSGAGRFRSQAIGGAQDLLQILILHEARDPGHCRKQRGIGKGPWGLGLTLNHLTFFTQQLIALRHHRQRRAVVLFITLFVAEQGSPAGLRQKTRLRQELTVGDIQLDLALAEHRIRAELHQILAGNQAIDLCFIVMQVYRAAARRGDNRMVGIDFFIVPAAVTPIRIHHRLWE